MTLKRLDREEAERLAISALGYLGSDFERSERFVRLTGLTPQTLRQAGDDPRFLASVLDYLMADEPLLVDFAGTLGIDAQVVVAARAALGDGDFTSDDV